MLFKMLVPFVFWKIIGQLLKKTKKQTSKARFKEHSDFAIYSWQQNIKEFKNFINLSENVFIVLRKAGFLLSILNTKCW